jgi:hypothetical protein
MKPSDLDLMIAEYLMEKTIVELCPLGSEIGAAPANLIQGEELIRIYRTESWISWLNRTL